MRIMGLDFGDKTVGVALSDPLFLNARPKEIIFRERPTKLRQTLARIEAIIEEEEVSEIVLGLPLNLDGTEGERVEKTREFAGMLERRTGMPITFHDERLTTVEADEYMLKNGIKPEDRKKHVDMIAAMIILQDYLDKKNG